MIFNTKELLERVAEDQELFREIIDTYLEHIPGQVKKLSRAIKDKDAAMVDHHAHSIKGASANIAASSVSKLAYEIEKAGKEEDVSLAADLYKNFKKMFDQLVKILSAGNFDLKM